MIRGAVRSGLAAAGLLTATLAGKDRGTTGGIPDRTPDRGLAPAPSPTGRPTPLPVGGHVPRVAGRPPTTFYVSPTGLPGADCRSPGSSCRSLAGVFGRMSGGDELILLDGTYVLDGAFGAWSRFQGGGAEQPPSGTADRVTYVHALHPGKVTILGPLVLGTATRKASYVKVAGVTYEGGGSLYNTSFVTIKDCGFHGAFAIGTNDHDQGNTDNLIENVWIWAARERIIALNYRANRNVWRRIVVRGDGCGTAECAGSGNPNFGFSVYDSHDVSVQNAIVVDRVLAPSDEPYADFGVAQHTDDPQWYFGRAEWLGTISLNAPDQGYYMEPDGGQTVDPTITISNAVAWNAPWGFHLARYGTNMLLENLTVGVRGGDGIRIAPELGRLKGTLRNVLVEGRGRFAVNSAYGGSHIDLTGSWSENEFKQVTPVNVRRGGARSLRYITRIEAGSPLAGKGLGGADIGANVVFRYGRDGYRFGERGYNTLTTTPLWPWPNEDRIKREMCATTTRGFCSPGKRLDGTHPVTLTSYVWETLGNPIPADIYP